jgi:thiol-disulfide isomerase/thioredoxin
MNNKKKTGTIILIVVLAIVCIIAMNITGGSEKTTSNTTSSSTAEEESAAVKDSEKKDFVTIKIDKYLEYYKGSTNTIILIARPTCHYCQIAEPILHNVAYKYDLTINYLNTDDFSSDDETTLVNSDSYFKNGFGTPLLLIVSNSKIVDKVEGLTTSEAYTSFFKTNGFIK